MVNENYQRGGEEEEKEFYDNQEGGMFERFIGRPKTAKQKADDEEKRATDEARRAAERAVNNATHKLPMTSAGVTGRLRTRAVGPAVLKPKVFAPIVTPAPSARPATLTIVDPEAIEKEILLPSSFSNASDKQKFQSEFLTKFNSLLKDLLVKRAKIDKKNTSLDLDKVKLIKRLFDMSHFNTKACAKYIFTSIKSSNLLMATDNNFKSMTDRMFVPYFEPVFFLDAIKTFIKNNIAELAAFSDDFMRFILQLLVIYYYPIFLLQTIRDKIIIAVQDIKGAQAVLSERDDSIIQFSKLINTISTDHATQDGGAPNWWEYFTSSREQSDADLLAAESELGEARSLALSKGQAALDLAQAELVEKQQRVLEAVAVNRNLLDKYIKEYRGDNSYVFNSQKLFYYALINFAVSISLDSTKYYKDAIISKLEGKFKELLDVKTRDEEVNKAEFESKFKSTQKDLETFKSNIIASEHTRYYQDLKDDSEELGTLLLSDGISPSEIIRTKNDIRRNERDMEHFKADMIKSQNYDSSKKQMVTLFQKEEDVDGARRALDFLPTINRKKNEMITQKEIGELLKNILFLDTISSDYTLTITRYINVGIEESNIFTFTDNDKIEKPPQEAATSVSDTGAVRSKVSAMPGTMAVMNARNDEERVAADTVVAVEAAVTDKETAYNAADAVAKAAAASLRAAQQAVAEAKTAQEANKTDSTLAKAVTDAEAAAERAHAEKVVADGEASTTQSALLGARAQLTAAREEAGVARVAREEAGVAREEAGVAREEAGAAAREGRRSRLVEGGKRITRRHKKHAGTRRYKKRAGTRRHKKRSGTHRKRKNTTR